MRRRDRIPRALLGMIALASAVEFSLAGRGDLADPVGLEWRFGDRAARRKAPGCPILCFGDSMLRCGIVPGAIEDRLGRRTCNLALTAAPASVSYFAFRHALDADARPEAVLVDFAPDLLDRDPRVCAPLLPELVGLRDGLDLAATLGDPDFFAALAISRILPSARDRRGIRARVVGLLNGPAPATQAPGGPRISYRDSWRCRPENRAYLERFLGLAAERGIPVFWLVPPCDPDVLGERERRGIEASFTRFARSVQARFPNVAILDGRRLGYGAAFFADPLHLNRRGALAFSDEVASALDRRGMGPLGQPRWVELAPSRLASSADRATR